MDDDPFRDGLLEVLRIGGIIDSFCESRVGYALPIVKVLNFKYVVFVETLLALYTTLLYSKQEQKYNTYNH